LRQRPPRVGHSERRPPESDPARPRQRPLSEE
jgi:hypothetical protein